MDGFQIWAIVVPVTVVLGVWMAQALNDYRKRGPRPTWDGVIVWWITRIYARLMHRVRAVGLENMRAAKADGRPIILVSNHTGAADPIVIQAVCEFEPRWMMMRSMHRGIAIWAARYGRIILVEQNQRDFASTRLALRHLRTGACIGIFPEGGIERPPGVHLKFHTGVGFLVKKSGALVLPVWLEGMPKVNVAMAALWTPGRARVHFAQPMTFDRSADVESITTQIRDSIARMSQWPTIDTDASQARR